jgi:transcription initiation factor TFIID subunit TAF12
VTNEFDVLYQRYLEILENYIDDNALQEINISMSARLSANEIKPKHIFWQSSSEKIRGIFEMPVREVHGVIRNNLYGDLRRYLQSQSQSQQQQQPQQQQQQQQQYNCSL